VTGSLSVFSLVSRLYCVSLIEYNRYTFAVLSRVVPALNGLAVTWWRYKVRCFSFQSDFVGFFALLRDWGVLAVKAKGGVFRERPLRKGPSRSTHLKLLGYRVTGAAGRRHVRAVKNPNSGEASTVCGLQR
jgi:hypothetical protein